MIKSSCAAIFGGLIVVFLAGCSNGSRSTTQADRDQTNQFAGIKTCLKKSSVELATSPMDLTFATEVKTKAGRLGVSFHGSRAYSIKPAEWGAEWRVYVVPKETSGAEKIDLATPISRPSNYQEVAYLLPPALPSKIQAADSCL